jgi:nicotinamide phosphoribosyltransferase
MVTVEATDPDCGPLTNVIETLLTHLWHSSNVATISRDLRVYLQKEFERSADTNTLLPFMLHDFGFRGVSSVESAGMGGAGHLINFMGTDTLIAITYAQRYYGAGMAGFSVPASEHSVMTSFGEDGEIKMFERLINEYPNGILSVVSDSYNIETVLTSYLPKLKDKILARNGKFVVRPDSPRWEGDTAANQIIWIATVLEAHFGSTVNSKGYKVLNPKIGIIYGDGLSVAEIKECVAVLIDNGWSAETCVYGMGGGLLQKHNRDTQRNAFKCSAQFRDGVWHDIQKKPLDITKASKTGRMKLVWNEGAHGKVLTTVPITDERPDVMETVFENGVITKSWTWEEIILNATTRLLGE